MITIRVPQKHRDILKAIKACGGPGVTEIVKNGMKYFTGPPVFRAESPNALIRLFFTPGEAKQLKMLGKPFKAKLDAVVRKIIEDCFTDAQTIKKRDD